MPSLERGLTQAATVEPPSEDRQRYSPQFGMNSWDAQRQPPPADSQPEAINFPATHYEMSQDTKQFVPPERYPSPPKDMWYEIPKERPAPAMEKPRAIFPWESSQPKPARTFNIPAAPKPDPETGSPESSATPAIQVRAEQNTEEPVPARQSQPADPPSETLNSPPTSTWSSFSLFNAWDDMPEIERYVSGLKRHRRTKSQEARLLAAQGVVGAGNKRSNPPTGLKLTDFPSEVERPSLPVTPAPIRRPSFWGDDAENQAVNADIETLPTAEGVPSQLEWVGLHDT